MKVVAGFMIEKVFRSEIEATTSMTTTITASSDTRKSVEVSISPGEKVKILQEVAKAQAGFVYLTVHFEVRDISESTSSIAIRLSTPCNSITSILR